MNKKPVKKGLNQHGNVIINLVMTFGIVLILGILFLSVGGQTYATAKPWNIGLDQNTAAAASPHAAAISADINRTSVSFFDAQQSVAQQIPLFALIVIIGAFLGLLGSYYAATGFGGGGGGGGPLL